MTTIPERVIPILVSAGVITALGYAAYEKLVAPIPPAEATVAPQAVAESAARCAGFLPAIASQMAKDFALHGPITTSLSVAFSGREVDIGESAKCEKGAVIDFRLRRARDYSFISYKGTTYALFELDPKKDGTRRFVASIVNPAMSQ